MCCTKAIEWIDLSTMFQNDFCNNVTARIYVNLARFNTPCRRKLYFEMGIFHSRA